MFDDEKIQSLQCPCCDSKSSSGLYLFPLCFKDLEQSIELRKACAIAQSIQSPSKKNKYTVHRPPEADMYDEAAFRVFSQGKTSSIPLKEGENHRTGRWNEEEILYVDHLVAAFNNGQLPIPDGVKLNRFLCDILLCKSSRLTKKMKNAKLSTRSFKRGAVDYTRQQLKDLSALQENLIFGVSAETSRLELGFNITKQWRSYFSNLCVQVGYPLLNSSAFIASLEEVDRRAQAAEERVKKLRRRNMMGKQGCKSEESSRSANPPLPHGSKRPLPVRRVSGSQFIRPNATTPDLGSIAGLISEEPQHKRQRTFSDEFGDVLQDLIKGPNRVEEFSHTSSDPSETSTGRYPKDFMEAIVLLLEENNLPFQHADVWVPSCSEMTANDPNPSNVKLLNAGHITRRDQPSGLTISMQHFGDYGTSFSYSPGEGIPGRVYGTGKAMWDSNLGELNPSVFPRASGAKAFGVQTAMGIPLSTQGGVGRIVVILYSYNHVPEDSSLVDLCVQELTKYMPQPRWKLVIGVGKGAKTLPRRRQARNVSSMEHKIRKQPEIDVLLNDSFGEQDFAGNAANSPLLSPFMERSNVRAISRSMSPLILSESNEDATEQEIISLLGGQMPATPAGQSTSSSQENGALLKHFMAIRLLLLRPAIRRSTEENEIVEVLKSSYKAYASRNNRSGAELANLLARDWECLKSTDSTDFGEDLALESATTLPNNTQQPTISMDPSSLTRGSSMPINNALRLPVHTLAKPTSLPSLGKMDALPGIVRSSHKISIGSSQTNAWNQS